MKFITELVSRLKNLDVDYLRSDDRKYYQEGKELFSSFKEDYESLFESGKKFFEEECIVAFSDDLKGLEYKLKSLNIKFETEIKMNTNQNKINDVDMSEHEAVNEQLEVNVINPESKEDSKNEMQIFNIEESSVQLFKNEYASLLVKSLDDTEVIEKVEKGVKDLQQMRLKVDARHKDLKAPYLDKCNYFDSLKKSIRGVLDPIEEHLKSQNKKIKDLREEELKRKEAEEKKRVDDRVVLLKENGIVFENDFYQIGNVSTDITVISKLDDEGFNKLLEKVRSENERLQEIARIEAERLKKEQEEREAEAKRLEEQRKEQEAEAERLKQEAEKIKQENERLKKQLEEDRLKLEQEAEAMRNQIKQSKIDSQKLKFIELGVFIEYDPLIGGVDFPYSVSFQSGETSQLFSMKDLPLEDVYLTEYLERAKNLIESVNDLEEKRILDEAERERLAEEAKEKAIKEAKKKAEKEAKELQKLKESLKPDAEKIQNYLNLLNECACTKLDNEIMNKKLDKFKLELLNITNDLQLEIDKVLK